MSYMRSSSRASLKETKNSQRRAVLTFTNCESEAGTTGDVPAADIDKDPDSNPAAEGSVSEEFGGPIPVQAGESRSIEIFFGKFTTFDTFHKSLCDHGVTVSDEERKETCTTKVKPETIKKLVMVGHPITSFAGLGSFRKLSEAWVTNCKIGEGRWSDLDGMEGLHKLYIYNCSLEKLDVLHFKNLRVLWVSGNFLPSLSFLGEGLPCLHELNAAKNCITYLVEEHFAKCTNLQILNLSGNPLCTVQDVQAVKVLPNLQNLYLADPVYGKCPVAALCDGRAMLISILTNVGSLDGKSVSAAERTAIQEYVNTRSLYYYASSILAAGYQVSLRKTSMVTTYKNMDGLGKRLVQLLNIASQFRRALDNVDLIPSFATAKNMLRDHIIKIDARAHKLRELAATTIKRLDTITHISRWEQEAQKWMKWIEFQSYGNTQCYIIQSVHGSRIDDGIQLCGCIHQLLSALACPNLWPQNSITKVETVIVIRDKGMEAGMEMTFEDYYAQRDEPVFIPPPDSPINPMPPALAREIEHRGYPYYGPPVPPPKPIPSYTKPDYRPPSLVHSFPDSVPGLPERMQPLFMFLICPSNASSNPLTYLHRLITEKSRFYKDIKVTNCLWIAANQNRHPIHNFAVVIVVKVLSEALQAIQCDRRVCCQHAWDCTSFSLKKPLALAPAYVLNISFTPEDKQAQWHKGPPNDDDILDPAKAALNNLIDKINVCKFPQRPRRSTKKSPFLKKVCDGIHADLSAIQLYVAKDGTIEPVDPLSSDTVPMPQSSFDIQNVSKFLGLEATQVLTTLDLSGNGLGLTAGMEGLSTLKKLNLSHNNLTTLSGLHKLPNLIELKVGWNHLRFLHSSAGTLSWVTPRLMTLELLPNPFQDIRDYAHIPVLLKRTLPMLHRIDVWSPPFASHSPLTRFTPPLVADAGFAHVAMAKTLIGTAHSYSDLCGRCLTDLELLPASVPQKIEGNGIDLNLSDNYLNSHSIATSHFVQTLEWQTALVQLQLQENMIATLDWVKDKIFPNVQILNLSNNFLTEVDLIPQSFPTLRYLHLCGNPLLCDIVILAPIRVMNTLNTLDCTGSPLASHPDYGGYVSKFLPTVQILDGTSISSWDLTESVERLGGTLCTDWLEEKMGMRNFQTLSRLSFTNANLQKVQLPSQTFARLVSLDLQDNSLSALTNLAALPSLRVLRLSHNSVNSLGSHTCTTCFTHTAESQALRSRGSTSSRVEGRSGQDFLSGLVSTRSLNETRPLPSTVASQKCQTTAKSGNAPRGSQLEDYMSTCKRRHKHLFPKLEVLILAHNGLASLSDLHLHSMPNLQTVILNCNNLTTLSGLNDLPTVKAIILDNNRIKEVPSDSLVGCESLRYLHLEHNRITALPRLPHLTNLTSLYLSYNKIQFLTDLTFIAGTGVTQLSLAGNPISKRMDYRLNLKAKIPQLTSLDGHDLLNERIQLDELAAKWFPGTASIIREYATHNPNLYHEKLQAKSGKIPQTTTTEFGLKVKSLSPHLASCSPRALQFSAFKPPKRPDFL